MQQAYVFNEIHRMVLQYSLYSLEIHDFNIYDEKIRTRIKNRSDLSTSSLFRPDTRAFRFLSSLLKAVRFQEP